MDSASIVSMQQCETTWQTKMSLELIRYLEDTKTLDVPTTLHQQPMPVENYHYVGNAEMLNTLQNQDQSLPFTAPIAAR